MSVHLVFGYFDPKEGVWRTLSNAVFRDFESLDGEHGFLAYAERLYERKSNKEVSYTVSK